MNVIEDPGGTTPQVSHVVTINNDCSEMESESSLLDTDASETKSNTSTKRKRALSRKICRHCNKKRRRHKLPSDVVCESDCHCENVMKKESSTVFKTPQLAPIPTPQPKQIDVTDTSLTEPRTPVGRKLYKACDSAPYSIHIQKIQSSPSNNVSINPISCGRFLKNKSTKNIVNGSLKKIHRNRLVLAFTNYADANSFLENQAIKQINCKAFIPTSSVTRMGVVRGVPTEWSEDEIIKNITVPFGCGNILKVRRINRKNVVEGKTNYVPVETVVLTFDGQVLPKRIFLCYNSLPVDLYIFPTVQCFNCCRYGHIKVQCRSTPRCFKCGNNHSGDSCNIDEDDVVCCLCSGSHYATNRKCPEFSRQKSIKELMANNCISYAEASKLHPPVTKSYSDVLTSIATPSSPLKNTFDISKGNSNKTSTSYKKTVFIQSNSVPKQYSKGYDKQAHAALTKDYDIPLPTIGSLNENNMPLSNMSTRDLIIVLIKSLTQSKNMVEPSNAAMLNVSNLFNNNINNGSINNTSVELPQY